MLALVCGFIIAIALVCGCAGCTVCVVRLVLLFVCSCFVFAVGCDLRCLLSFGCLWLVRILVLVGYAVRFVGNVCVVCDCGYVCFVVLCLSFVCYSSCDLVDVYVGFNNVD